MVGGILEQERWRGHTFGRSTFARTEDARRLHYMVRGAGEPTVVFESGMGFSRSIWGLVQPAVAERVRTVVYDRAGTGRSDDDPRPRTLARLSGDLDALLRELGPGPYVLVGHSWGGPIVRVTAESDPERIRGLVLVDQSDENCALYFARAARRNRVATRVLLPMLAGSGLYRRFGGKLGAAQPADVVADHHAEDFTVRAARTLLAEQDSFVPELRRLRDRRIDLGEIEMSVISGTRMPRRRGLERAALIDAHRRTATRTPNARHVEAARSGHLVMFTEPDLVISEILRLAGAAAQSR